LTTCETWRPLARQSAFAVVVHRLKIDETIKVLCIKQKLL